MSKLEIVAVLLSITYVVLASKEIIYCWLAALVSVSIYFYLCWTANLQAEAGLQVYYFLMAIYGWWQWDKRKREAEKPIVEWSLKSHFLLLTFGATAVFLLAHFVLLKTQASMPYIDAFTTVFSVIATYMTAKKIKSNWLYFIVIDAVSIYMYHQRDLKLTAGLFVVYTILAVWAYWQWDKVYKKQLQTKAELV